VNISIGILGAIETSRSYPALAAAVPPDREVRANYFGQRPQPGGKAFDRTVSYLDQVVSGDKSVTDFSHSEASLLMGSVSNRPVFEKEIPMCQQKGTVYCGTKSPLSGGVSSSAKGDRVDCPSLNSPSSAPAGADHDEVF